MPPNLDNKSPGFDVDNGKVALGYWQCWIPRNHAKVWIQLGSRFCACFSDVFLCHGCLVLENRLGIHVAVVPQHPKGMLPRVLLEHLLPPVVWMRTYIIKVMISGPGSLSQHTELIQ
jgi:hypothetical protein